jgi:hypothetical protein
MFSKFFGKGKEIGLHYKILRAAVAEIFIPIMQLPHILK